MIAGSGGERERPIVNGQPDTGVSGDSGPAGEPGRAWRCALCGYKSTGGVPQCSGCALMPACKVNHCPNCGYQFVESSVILTWISRAVHGIMRMTKRGREKVSP